MRVNEKFIPILWFSFSESKHDLRFWIQFEQSLEYSIQWILLFDGAYDAYILQIINVYNQKYESGAAFWPHVHRRVIIGLLISQLLLMGLFSMRDAEKSSAVLVALPILTIWVHKFCQGRFESAFVKFPLQVSNKKSFNPFLNLCERSYCCCLIHICIMGTQIIISVIK